MTYKSSRRLVITGIALAGLMSAGCSSSQTTTPRPTASYIDPESELTPVNSQRSKDASALVRALSLGGDGTARKYISPSAHFSTNGAMKDLKGCKVTTSWYAPSKSSSTLTADVSCGDGEIMAVDATFDTSDKVTKLTGQGVYRSFDSSVVGS